MCPWILQKTSQTSCDPLTSEGHPGSKNLDDKHGDQQYQDMFKEMMRINHESREKSEEEDSRLRRIVGEDNFELFKGGASRRRGGSGQLRSVAGRRHARSQALRREKLNSQGLRSHLTHMSNLRRIITHESSE